jgi:transcriptional regulator with GAF, ATPase, and Fis domain
MRELQNVVEHAVISSRDDWLYPEVTLERSVVSPASAAGVATPIWTADKMRELQRDNIRHALDARSWKISGDQGAAHRLNLKPSTLRSQMNALGIQEREA